MSANLTRTVFHKVTIPLSGIDIAELFWELDGEEQAEFFNRLATKERLVQQLQAVTDSPNLNLEGRAVMDRIGEYAHEE